MKQLAFLVAAGFLGLNFSLANAQNQDQNTPLAKKLKLKEARPTVSLAAYLQLQEPQIARLNRLYDFAARRLKQEKDLAQWNLQLREAQSPTNFDERRATRLMREINEAQQKNSTDFVATRAKSLQVLDAIQRAQLESLATDTRFQVRNDRFSQLLLLPADSIRNVTFNSNSRFETSPNRTSRAPKRNGIGGGTATYGVYGGYDYGGPQYGVRAGYGRGPVGVYAGVGRGGPSIGIGIGGILGGRWR